MSAPSAESERTRPASLTRKKGVRILSLIFLFLLSGCINSPLLAQNLAGISGMFNAPTAQIMEDGTLVIGASMMDRNYGGFKYRGDPEYAWDALGMFASVSALPWVELQFRWTHSVGRTIRINPIYAPDRMMVLRVRVLDGQDHWYPSVTLGAEDPARFFGSGSPSYYASLYMVATKQLNIGGWTADLTAGYGLDPEFPWMVGRAEFIRQRGLFGGIAIGHKQFPGSAVMLEHDSFRWNIGARVLILRHVQLLAGLYDLKAFSGGLSYRFYLKA